MLQELDLTHRRHASGVQNDILAAYARRGWEPPSDFSRFSQFLAAGTARRGTRSVRLLVETRRGLKAATPWTPGASTAPTDSVNLSRQRQEFAEKVARQNRAELRKMWRTLLVCAGLACASAVGAYLLAGIARGVLIVVAIFFAALTAWIALWVFGVSVLTGAGERMTGRSRPSD